MTPHLILTSLAYPQGVPVCVTSAASGASSSDTISPATMTKATSSGPTSASGADDRSNPTVSAAFVAANAGEYQRGSLIFRSDGKGRVVLLYGPNDPEDNVEWAGVAWHVESRFRPLPSPEPKPERPATTPAPEWAKWARIESDRGYVRFLSLSGKWEWNHGVSEWETPRGRGPGWDASRLDEPPICPPPDFTITPTPRSRK